MIIAIDGPAASGKSTVAKLVAKQLGYLYIDSGAMYRAVTLDWLRKFKTQSKNDMQNLAELLNTMDIRLEENSKKIYLNNEDISEAIRANEVSKNVSYIASFKNVRDKLTNIQRSIAGKENVIMDGRDIGTVVFPQAELKIFMIASPRVRAERRLKDLTAKGENIQLEELIKEIETRDRLDSERELSPLKKANDAIEINTDDLTIEEVIKKICDYNSNCKPKS